jgi:class 3 adenylate cyclase/tetratricopeptide (TPR) repeat protein
VPACPSCGQENPAGFKFCSNCGSALQTGAPSREQRKTVTVLFCDITGSTALGESTDPEALRALLARYFERMKSILESHGASVEKFIGDAVMAVFGVPQVHEDDALRACRAAVEMRDALPELGLQARIGVNTGEVVTGTEERLATGDAVNVAARLEQAARPGEILIGEETLALVRDAVASEEVEPLALKGKAEAVPAYRLGAVLGELERTHGTRFVGRETELALIHAAWERAQEEHTCQLVTIVGEAGVGKSRLVAEALDSVPAPAIRGRCLSYGEGITYWPVVEVIKQLDALPSDATAANAIRGVLGESDQLTSSDEIAWAVRKLFEEKAPLVCVFDDLQWAEDTFFDLVEHVTLFSGGAPLLLLCIARPELSERRPEWDITVRLEPLPREAVDALIPDTIEDELRTRIERAAGGNPLFVQEMVAMASETEGEVAVPPNLQALLAARLDQLEAPERAALERGSIEGEVFHRGSVQALSGNGHVTPRLAALVRKALVRPDRSQLLGDDAFRFRHLLIRDAAYDALPKATRADLHERFAYWLEEHGAQLVELDEILGYHLEQACRYRSELGAAESPVLKEQARARLTTAARRAWLRGDVQAVVSLVERAIALVPEDEIDLTLELQLLDALFVCGRMGDAADRARSLARRGSAAGEPVPELCGQIWEALVAAYVEPEGATERLEALANRAIPVFAADGNDLALFLAHYARGQAAHMYADFDRELEDLEQAQVHAQRLRLVHLEIKLAPSAAAARLFGTTPIPDLLVWLDEQEARGLRHGGLRAHRAVALACLGRFDEAWAIHDELREELVERGAKVPLALALGHQAADIALFQDDPARAARFGEEGCRLLEELGERSWLSGAVAKLGESYYRLGRLDEAEDTALRAAELGATDDAVTQLDSRLVRAKVYARRGDREGAERLLAEASELAQEVGTHYWPIDLDTAEVYELTGRVPEAVHALDGGIAKLERKGIVSVASLAKKRRAALLLQLEQ